MHIWREQVVLRAGDIADGGCIARHGQDQASIGAFRPDIISPAPIRTTPIRPDIIPRHQRARAKTRPQVAGHAAHDGRACNTTGQRHIAPHPPRPRHNINHHARRQRQHTVRWHCAAHPQHPKSRRCNCHAQRCGGGKRHSRRAHLNCRCGLCISDQYIRRGMADPIHRPGRCDAKTQIPVPPAVLHRAQRACAQHAQPRHPCTGHSCTRRASGSPAAARRARD